MNGHRRRRRAEFSIQQPCAGPVHTLKNQRPRDVEHTCDDKLMRCLTRLLTCASNFRLASTFSSFFIVQMVVESSL